MELKKPATYGAAYLGAKRANVNIKVWRFQFVIFCDLTISLFLWKFRGFFYHIVVYYAAEQYSDNRNIFAHFANVFIKLPESNYSWLAETLHCLDSGLCPIYFRLHGQGLKFQRCL